MGIATSLKQHLDSMGIAYIVTQHPYAEGSANTARSAKIPPQCMAKAVLFRDEDFNYTLAVLPASHKVKRHTINEIFDRHMELADEEETLELFGDCQFGAIPAVGMAYNIDVIWDDSLQDASYIWIEAGDHEHLIRLDVNSFTRLMDNSLHEHISTAQRYHPPPKQVPLSYYW
ncbi:aminoacyl-tRNA deacylase [Aurantivibrio plasticivorans]